MNTIKIYLKESGSVAELNMDFKLYAGSYQNKLIDIYVPKSILYSSDDGRLSNAIKIGGLFTAEDGSTIKTNAYYLDYLKDEVVKGIEYSVYERRLPKELTTNPGNILLTANVISVDTSGVYGTNVLQIVTSQTCNLTIYKSAYFADKDTMDATQYEEVNSKITKNQESISVLNTKMTSAETELETVMHSYNLIFIDNYAIDYKGADGYKTPRAIYTNYKNTVIDGIDNNGNISKTEVTGSLLVTSFIKEGIIYQTECLFAGGRQWVRELTINNDENYTAISTNNFIPIGYGDAVASDPLKLDKKQDISNAGNILGIGKDGYITPNFTISNPNLLINGDFRVNQRGQSSYTGEQYKYSVDRWIQTIVRTTVETKSGAVENNAGGIKFTETTAGANNWLLQSVENFENLLGKTVTLSCKLSNITITSGNYVIFGLYNAPTAYQVDTLIKSIRITSEGTYNLTINIPETLSSSRLNVAFVLPSNDLGATITIDWVKLEHGYVATPFTPRPYAEELALCQRYGLLIDGNMRTRMVGYIDNSYIDFFIPTPSTMREFKSIEINNFAVTDLIGNPQDGFTFTVPVLNKNGALIRATKTNHGLKDAQLRTTGLTFIDAEIY